MVGGKVPTEVEIVEILGMISQLCNVLGFGGEGSFFGLNRDFFLLGDICEGGGDKRVARFVHPKGLEEGSVSEMFPFSAFVQERIEVLLKFLPNGSDVGFAAFRLVEGQPFRKQCTTEKRPLSIAPKKYLEIRKSPSEGMDDVPSNREAKDIQPFLFVIVVKGDEFNIDFSSSSGFVNRSLLLLGWWLSLGQRLLLRWVRI